MSLHDAAYCRDELTAGQEPDRTRVLTSFALNALRDQGTADRDLLDAAAGLEILATGGTLDLCEPGKMRAAALGAAFRRVLP